MRAFLVAAAAIVGLAATASPARAESLLDKVPRLIERSGWFRAHVPGTPSGDKHEGPLTERHEPSASPDAFLGSSLTFSFVARDWRHSYSLTDGKALLFDRIRLISSSRMAVQRVSLAGGRLLPYAEVSFGQWRVDPELMPYIHTDNELAAQIAAGFEVHVAPRAAFAWDIERTSMYRDPRDPQNLPFVNVVASFAALRAEF